MRIALFTEVFLPKTDGVVHTLCHLLDHLARRGHTSVLFAPAGGPARYARTPVIGLPAAPVPFYPEFKLVPPTADVAPQLDAFGPDLIHVFNPVSFGLVGLRLARQIGAPVAASYQTDVPGFAARWGLGVFSEFLWSYMRWVHDRADLNFAPSEFTQRELQAKGFSNLRVWGRGVDTVRFGPEHDSAMWRARLTEGHPDAPLILSVGRLAPEKRFGILRAVVDALPGARLAIVGDGPSRRLLERQFAGTPTYFAGYLRGAELAAAYASADLFVLTSANETFGNVVLEAMASGLPVVAPDAGGQTDHARHGENGLIYAAEDANALVAAVARLAGDANLRRVLGGAGRRHAEGQQWERVLDGLLADWAELVPAPALRLAA
jgi:phosphatidylinositol alpha 1,6-mannosyltransferase